MTNAFSHFGAISPGRGALGRHVEQRPAATARPPASAGQRGGGGPSASTWSWRAYNAVQSTSDIACRAAASPPFAALEARKRGRDRRRMAVGAGALSVVALAVVGVVVPTLDGGGDRLAPGRPAEGVSRTAFSVQYDASSPIESRPDGADPALARCSALPGAQERVGVKLSSPPLWIVTVEGDADQTSAVRDCLAALDSATVRTIPAADTTGDQDRTFRVSSDGTADAAAYTSGVEKCLALPGVTGSSVQESYPATYEMTARGTAADGLANCLAAVVGAKVEATGDTPAQGAGLDAFINRCVGGQNPVLAPEYVGLSEAQATRTMQPAPADTVAAVRVVGRDGACLDIALDLRSDRVNLLIADGKVVWAGRF